MAGKKARANERFKPAVLENGDTKVELFTRARYLLSKSGDQWSDSQRKRAGLLFGIAPEIGRAHSLTCSLRSIFRNKKNGKDDARNALHAWYDKVADSGIKEMEAVMDCIKAKEDEVLNYFVNRSTNAAAESLNSRMKGFRSELRGVSDLPFFFYRCCMIFG